MRVVGLQSQSRRSGEETNLLALPGIKTPVLRSSRPSPIAIPTELFWLLVVKHNHNNVETSHLGSCEVSFLLRSYYGTTTTTTTTTTTAAAAAYYHKSRH
jgi:hypothetical protein